MSGALRVCHLITQLELGGAQQNTLYTVGHLDRAAFAPSLIAGPGGILDDDARALSGVVFETCPWLARPVHPWRDARALADLVARLRRLAPHVVHTHSSKAGILGRVAAAIAGVPVIVHTVHGWGFTPNQSPAVRRAFVLAERAVTGLTDQLVAVSRANARLGEQERVAPASSFAIIHSGIELARFRQVGLGRALRAQLGLAAGTPLVGMVACLKPQKAPDDFVRVAALVAAERPDARFVVAGDGEERPALLALIREHGLGERVTLLGWRRDTEEVIGALDVLVLTSLHEGLPRVVPEAMAAGKPVVATAVDGTPEAVVPGETGYLRAPRDVAGMAQDVLALLADEPLRVRMGLRANRLVLPWDIDEMVRAQERLYTGLAERRGLPLTSRHFDLVREAPA